MFKKSVSISPEAEKDLLGRLMCRFGMPVCYEDLTIYFVADSQNVKISVQPLGSLVVSFRTLVGEELYHYNARPEEIKNIIKSLYSLSQGMGYISISRVKRFDLGEGRYVKVINTRDAGCICSFLGVSAQDMQELSAGLALPMRPSSAAPLESIIGYDVSREGILHSKILEYLERNGIYYRSLSEEPTYRQLMSGKSNDYSLYEPAFELMTGRSIVDSRILDEGASYVKGKSVSIIIPYRNSASSIVHVLNSIEAQCGLQSFQNVEVIIIDDGSDMPFSEMCALNDLDISKYDFFVKIVRVESNIGVSMARQLGTALSKGELLFFLDSDILPDKNYLIEHAVRMLAIPNAVFVSLKENLDPDDPRVSLEAIKGGLDKPKSFSDLRVHKKIDALKAVGSYRVETSLNLNILESTNFLKHFNGSRVYGIYDLSCMVVGHNFSTKRSNIEKAKPFASLFKGWGMEDVYAGLRFIGSGIYIVPIISTGVYHINHPPRSGSESKKSEEHLNNTNIINRLLDSKFDN